MRTTTAEPGNVRTGDVITNDWTAGSGKAIEVAYTITDVFPNPEGQRLPRIRFAGWERSLHHPDYIGRWIDAGFGVRLGDRIYVVVEARDNPRPYQEV